MNNLLKLISGGENEGLEFNRRANRERRECRRQGFIQILNLYISSVNSAFSVVNLRCDKVKIIDQVEEAENFVLSHIKMRFLYE